MHFSRFFPFKSLFFVRCVPGGGCTLDLRSNTDNLLLISLLQAEGFRGEGPGGLLWPEVPRAGRGRPDARHGICAGNWQFLQVNSASFFHFTVCISGSNDNALLRSVLSWVDYSIVPLKFVYYAGARPCRRRGTGRPSCSPPPFLMRFRRRPKTICRLVNFLFVVLGFVGFLGKKCF